MTQNTKSKVAQLLNETTGGKGYYLTDEERAHVHFIVQEGESGENLESKPRRHAKKKKSTANHEKPSTLTHEEQVHVHSIREGESGENRESKPHRHPKKMKTAANRDMTSTSARNSKVAPEPGKQKTRSKEYVSRTPLAPSELKDREEPSLSSSIIPRSTKKKERIEPTTPRSTAIENGQTQSLQSESTLDNSIVSTEISFDDSTTMVELVEESHFRYRVRSIITIAMRYKAIKLLQILLAVYVFIFTFAPGISLRDPESGLIIDQDSEERTENGLILVNGTERPIVGETIFQVACIGIARISAFFMYPGEYIALSLCHDIDTIQPLSNTTSMPPL
jgi:hypothetical protein